MATRPPKLPKHDEYTLDFRFVADEPFLIARILEDGRRVRFSRDRASSANAEIEEHLRFFPDDWHGSDDVQINLGGMRHGVTSADLKRDPRELVSASPTAGATTGSLVQVATVQLPLPIRISAFVALRRDVTVSRSRWRLPPESGRGLLEALRFLLTGNQSGDLALPE